MKQYLTKDGIVRAIDGAPEWVIDLAREMHDDELPNEWRWSVIWEIANAEVDLADEDAAIEFAEHLVPIWNHEVFSWYADNGGRVSYIENPFLGEGVMDALCQGIYVAIKGMIDTYLNDDHILYSEVVDAYSEVGTCDECDAEYTLGSDDHDGETGLCWDCARPVPEPCLRCGATTTNNTTGYCSPICEEIRK